MMDCCWYKEVCPQKKCNGEGYVCCKIRCKGIIYDRMRQEYKRVVVRGAPVNRIQCFSFLEKSLNVSSLNL